MCYQTWSAGKSPNWRFLSLGKEWEKKKTIVIEPVDNIALFQHLPQWKMHPLLNIDGDLHYLASASSTGKKKSFEYI